MTLIAALLALAALLLAVSLLRHPTRAAWALAAGAAALLGGVLLTRLGQFDVASALLPSVGLALTTCFLLSGDGSSEAAVFGFVPFVVMAGFLMGKRAAPAFGLLSILSLALVNVVQAASFPALPASGLASLSNLAVLAALLALTASLTYIAVDHLAARSERAAEAALRTAKGEAESRLSRLSADLEAATRELQALGRATDEFIANVSHELRGPIANMRLYLDLLAAKPEDAQKCLPILIRETERVNQVLDGLLTLHRLEQDHGNLDLAPVDLNQLARDFIEDRTELASRKGLELAFTPEPRLPPANADPSLIGQVLSILLANALNYTPAGGTVAVRTAAEDREGIRWVGFGVSDSGPGLSPDDPDHLFTRFYRGSAARQLGIPGTGLGLAIAKQIVNCHNGRMEVDPRGLRDRGATFRVWLQVLPSSRSTR